MGLLSRTGPWLLAAAGGALWAACFGPEPRTVAPWIALVPLFLALSTAHRRRRAFGLGWLYGTVFWIASIPWIVPTLQTFGGIAPWLSVVLLLGLALYLGAFVGIFAALALPVWRRASEGGGRLATAAALLGLPGLWIALEWLRGWLFSGFPWNLAGYAWTAVPGALPLAAWIGVWGVGFLGLAVNGAAALAVARRRLRPAVGCILGALLLLAVAARYAVPPAPGELVAGGAGAPVRIVQPAIYNQVEFDRELTQENYRRLFRMSEEACDRPGAVVIWPESAAWPFELDGDGVLARDVEAFVARTGCSLVLNSTYRTGEVYYNSAYVVAPDGSRERYDKRHLVPFGEYVPLAGVFTFIDSLARSAGDYSAAGEVTLLPWGSDRLGMAICFEVTFPAEVADLARAGATSLVTITNDAWYGDTWAPWQHFTAARWRAAETRRPLLRAAVTGVSGVIAPDGSVRQILGVGETGTLRARVVGRTDRSPFVRAPLAVPIVSALLALAALLYGFRAGRGPGTH